MFIITQKYSNSVSTLLYNDLRSTLDTEQKKYEETPTNEFRWSFDPEITNV